MHLFATWQGRRLCLKLTMPSFLIKPGRRSVYTRMKGQTFREFVEQQPWKGKSQDIIATWEKLKPNQPINIAPIPLNHIGTRYDDDGIRITGRGEFINSVLSRLKDLLIYDKYPNTAIDIEYRQVSSKESSSKAAYQMEAPKYVCYLHVVEKKPKAIKPAGSAGKTTAP